MATASSTAPKREFILTISCSDGTGIVASVSGLLATMGLNILDSQQYGDPSTNRFFMRVHFAPHTSSAPTSVEVLLENFESVKQQYGMDLAIYDAAVKPRVMVMVSKIGHTLNDLLFRASTGSIPIDIPLIVSNHDEFGTLASTYGIPFKHLPVTSATKVDQETRIMELYKEYNIEFIVLARYMQIISENMCAALPGRMLNIHHSALPSFLGANPYRQAYNRGVKLIGATSHFVTADLDEGPIIEQDVTRVDHSLDPKALTQLGSTVENIVLGRAVKWVAERRVLLNGHKTVVFN